MSEKLFLQLLMDKYVSINSVKELINNFPGHKFNWNEGIYYGSRYGNLDLVNLMIDKGADNWNQGLNAACRGGHLDIAKLMIAKGASDFNHPMYIAWVEKHLALVHLMILNGGSPSHELNSLYINRPHFYNRYYIKYLFDLPKFDKSVCFLLNLHQGLIFRIIKYL
jgi:ankyrin repeat protein